MEYNFREIERKWREKWIADRTYHVDIEPNKPKYYVLDMFPYPSGAGLHVGHPLGYIASDIYARYKRLRGFNVLHPMGYDAYGLPAEQYAVQTGQHPAVTTEQNIKRYREQLDKMGFCFDWDREIRTCDPDYYKWTQWVFIQMFNSYYCYQAQQARPIAELIECFESQGNKNLEIAQTEELHFTAEEWKSWNECKQQEVLMNYRIAYLSETTVNWCEALGTVLANDEVVDGVSERGGYPVVQRKMKQWSLRVSAYAQRLLDGLEKIDWTESLKETQRNWIGRSEGAEIVFHLTPSPSPKERGTANYDYETANRLDWRANIDNAREMRKEQTEAENILWQNLRNKNVDNLKFRRQHLIDQFIVDFVCIEKKLVIEVDGGYHNQPEQKEYDGIRTKCLNENGFQVIRFTNEEVLFDLDNVIKKIISAVRLTPFSPLQKREGEDFAYNSPLLWRGAGGEVAVFTTRADTIYGVTFMVLAPESELVNLLTTDEQRSEVQNYLEQTKKRTERERIADRKVTGVFSGSYAINPVNGTEIPVWISDYVLAGYGTGAIMAVPAHDSRDYAFAKHFNLPIIPLIEGADVSEESFDAKEGIMINSPSQDLILNSQSSILNLNGLTVKEAIGKAKEYIVENNLGTVKVNFRLRDAIFSRQRYWGEPFPIYYKDGMPYTVALEDLPLELPEVDKFLPTETGEPPLGRAKDWVYEVSEACG
jgi:leucyl-tRNA synthetase